MENLNQSLSEAVCIDEEVFFGPITEKERKIREQFENLHRNAFNGTEVSKTVEDDESSIYKSFSVDESKYDSFDDSLNEVNDKMPEEAKPISSRRNFEKIKSKRSGFYDSLEDVRSLVSNIDKCSISCEIENESNINSKHFVEDSLKVLTVPNANKNNFINDQIHFDDDSLAILECETTFSDSLEEVNVLESIEIEEINDFDNISIENHNVILTMDENGTAYPKNLFDTSVENVCQKKKDNDTADQEDSYDDKNLLYDSLSNSDFRDILTDSLDENKEIKEMLSFSKYETVNVSFNEENMIEKNESKQFGAEHASPLPNLFSTSAQIIAEKLKDNNNSSQGELLSNKDLLNDSLSNSEVKDVSKDSLEESDKLNENLSISPLNNVDNSAKLEDNYQKQDILDTSIQIISEKFKSYYNASPKEFFNDKILLKDPLSTSEIKDSLEESVKSNENSLQQSIGDNIVELEDTSQKQNTFDTSVQIVSEKLNGYNSTSPKEFINDKNLFKDPLSNPEIKDITKDSLEESGKSNENFNSSQQNIGDNTVKLEDTYQKQNTLETSVQIIYDNALDDKLNQKINNPEEDLDSKGFQEIFNKKTIIETSSEQSFVSKSSSQNLSETFLSNINIDSNKNALSSHEHLNKNEVKPDPSVFSNPAFIDSVNDRSNVKIEPISLESCHLKILSDDVNIEKDLKFQLHIEVKVGDKKCQIASQDIKILPVANERCKFESNSIPSTSFEDPLSHSISSSVLNTQKNYPIMQLNNPEVNLNHKDINVVRTHSGEPNSGSHPKAEMVNTSNITQRAKSSKFQTSCANLDCMDFFNDVSLLQALDLSDLSTSFLNESVIQSKDSLISLNLYSPDKSLQNFHASKCKNKNKENIPEYEYVQAFGNENYNAKRKTSSPNKAYISKTSHSLQKCSSFKETSKKTPGTKIPVRKIDNFAIPAPTPTKFNKPFPTTSSSTEKVKKCHHSPHSVDSSKKTPVTTPNKIPHICNVRNTIFSKVPQIIPSKKYMNVQSPVAQYIKNSGPVKTPGHDPVLQDCMNHMMESPLHLHHTQTSGSVKAVKKKN